MRKKLITLFFTLGAHLSDEEADLMESLPGARQRNASLIDPEGPLEKCDFVAGPAVPDNYAAAYPVAPGGEAEEGEASADMTSAQLKAALDEAKVAYPKNAKKADLVVLYDQHFAE